jgi:hypothetical protein
VLLFHQTASSWYQRRRPLGFSTGTYYQAIPEIWNISRSRILLDSLYLTLHSFISPIKVLWLYQGFRLEFLGLSSFVPGLHVTSLAFFAVNIWILGIIVTDVGCYVDRNMVSPTAKDSKVRSDLMGEPQSETDSDDVEIEPLQLPVPGSTRTVDAKATKLVGEYMADLQGLRQR